MGTTVSANESGLDSRVNKQRHASTSAADRHVSQRSRDVLRDLGMSDREVAAYFRRLGDVISGRCRADLAQDMTSRTGVDRLEPIRACIATRLTSNLGGQRRKLP
jgi:hypothetical protein